MNTLEKLLRLSAFVAIGTFWVTLFWPLMVLDQNRRDAITQKLKAEHRRIQQ